MTNAPISTRQLNRATLARQMLLRRENVSVLDAVRRVFALQAQEAASPYLALWNRVERFDARQLDAAFSERTVVKASLIRLTLHAVHAEDYHPTHTAMEPSLRASRLYDRRFKETGMTIDEADALVPPVTKFVARPQTSAAIEAMIAKHVGEPRPRAWWALKMYSPMHHAPTGATWSFGSSPSFVAAPVNKRPSHEQAVQWVLERYLQAFGPASMADFELFTMLRRPVVQAAVTALGERLVTLEGPNRARLLDVAGGVIPDGDLPAPPRLLGMWDSILFAYSDRGRVMPDQYRSIVIRRNGDTLPSVLVDGHVAGVWRPVVDGATNAIEVTAFHRLTSDTWKALSAEAASLLAFLAERDREVYRRYFHWWDKGLPAVQTRRFG